MGPEPILPIQSKLRRAPKRALKEDFILVLFQNLASGYENMNANLLKCGAVALST